MSDPLIQFENVSFSYRSGEVLKDVSFSLEEGEFLSIIGPNGSGKTTLLRVISGALAPDNGKILFRGSDMKTISRKSRARSIAVVPQEAGVAFPMSVMELVLLGRSPYHEGLSFEKEGDLDIALSSMKDTDTVYLRDRTVTEISGGEKQRVWIAKALAQEPELFLLDEPTSFLDLKHQLEVYDLLEKLNKERKITIISISHDINLAAKYSKRILLLNDGRIESMGRPEEVITEELIASVYKTSVLVERHKDSTVPFIIPVGRLE